MLKIQSSNLLNYPYPSLCTFADMWFNYLQNLVELLWAHPHNLFESRSFRFFIHSRVFPCSEPLSSSKRCKITIATAALITPPYKRHFILKWLPLNSSFPKYVGQAHSTMLDSVSPPVQQCSIVRPSLKSFAIFKIDQ